MSRNSTGSCDAVPHQWVRFTTLISRFTRNALALGPPLAVSQTSPVVTLPPPPAACQAPMRTHITALHQPASQHVSSARGWRLITRRLPLARAMLPQATLHSQVVAVTRLFAHLFACPHTGIFHSL